MWKRAGRAPSLRVAFALHLWKKHGKTSVRVRKTSVRLIKTSVSVQYTYYQNTHTHTHTHTHTYYKTIKKSPQYKLKQTRCKIYPHEMVVI
jgi:hypothetical protein